MRGVNKVIIVGRLGVDPESRQFSNGGNVTNISVATSEQWTDKQTGQKREATEWHRVALFNRLGEIAAQYLRKGSKVYIEGSLRTRKWRDQNGQDRYTTEIRADNLQMLGDKPQGQSQSGYSNPEDYYYNPQPMQQQSQPMQQQSQPMQQQSQPMQQQSQPMQQQSQPMQRKPVDAPTIDDIPEAFL